MAGAEGTRVDRPALLKGRTAIRAAVVGTAIGGLLSSSPAAANHDWGWNPDNTAHDVEKLSLTSNGSAAVDNGRTELDRSDLQTYTGTSDVHVEDSSFSDGWYGLAWCSTDVAPPSGGRCDHFWVQFNTRTTTRDSFSSTNWKKLGCHELGHTGGLYEQSDTATYPNSCMRQGKSEIINLDSHDISTINGDV